MNTTDLRTARTFRMNELYSFLRAFKPAWEGRYSEGAERYLLTTLVDHGISICDASDVVADYLS